MRPIDADAFWATYKNDKFQKGEPIDPDVIAVLQKLPTVIRDMLPEDNS